jgi:hypothetical protein
MTILWIDDLTEEIKLNNWLDPQKYSICYEDDFTRARNLIKKKGLLYYDVIILDVDFGRTKTTNEIEQSSSFFGLKVDEFKQEAGFHLFIDLIESGFPKKRIICFTGNVTPAQIEEDFLRLQIEPQESKRKDLFLAIDDRMEGELIRNEEKFDSLEQTYTFIETFIYNTYYKKAMETNTGNEFCRKFIASRIQPPKILSKKHPEYLSLWVDLTISGDYDYIHLRRLLIDYSSFLTDELNQKNIEIHKRLTNDKKFSFNKNEAISLLDNIVNLLPIQKPESKLSHTFTQLVFIMSHHWDTLEWPNKSNFFIDFKEEVSPKLEKDIALKCFFIIMKTVRNWSHHGDIFEKIDERTLAYLFLINARALFDLGDKCSSHETKLLKFISHPKGPMKLEDFEEKCKRRLSHHVQYARIINKFGHRRDLGINQILNESVKNLYDDQILFTNQDLIHGLFDCFWFLTSPPCFNKGGAEHIKPHGVKLKIHFFNFNYNAYPFLTDLSRHIYYKTFN